MLLNRPLKFYSKSSTKFNDVSGNYMEDQNILSYFTMIVKARAWVTFLQTLPNYSYASKKQHPYLINFKEMMVLRVGKNTLKELLFFKLAILVLVWTLNKIKCILVAQGAAKLPYSNNRVCHKLPIVVCYHKWL